MKGCYNFLLSKGSWQNFDTVFRNVNQVRAVFLWFSLSVCGCTAILICFTSNEPKLASERAALKLITAMSSIKWEICWVQHIGVIKAIRVSRYSSCLGTIMLPRSTWSQLVQRLHKKRKIIANEEWVGQGGNTMLKSASTIALGRLVENISATCGTQMLFSNDGDNCKTYLGGTGGLSGCTRPWEQQRKVQHNSLAPVYFHLFVHIFKNFALLSSRSWRPELRSSL